MEGQTGTFVVQLEIESRAQRVFRLCEAVRGALVERKHVRPEQAQAKVDWVLAMPKLDAQEIELTYLAYRYGLLDVIDGEQGDEDRGAGGDCDCGGVAAGGAVGVGRAAVVGG